MRTETPTLIVLRTWRAGGCALNGQKQLDVEQVYRAQLLSKRGFVHFIYPDEVNSDSLVQLINNNLNNTGGPQDLPPLNSAVIGAIELISLARQSDADNSGLAE